MCGERGKGIPGKGVVLSALQTAGQSAHSGISPSPLPGMEDLYIHWLIMDLPQVLEGSFGNGVIHFTNEQTEVGEEGNVSEITILKQFVK